MGTPDRKINKYYMDVKKIANSFFINVYTSSILGKIKEQSLL